MSDRTRKREWSQYRSSATSWYQLTSDGILHATPYDTLLTGVESCTDSGAHNEWTNIRLLERILARDRTNGREALAHKIDVLKQRNLGGPFLVNRRSWLNVSPECVDELGRNNSVVKEGIRGSIYPANPIAVEQDLPLTDAGVLFAAGGTAISRCRPQGSDFSAGTALGELREGLPKIFGSTMYARGLTPRSVAEEYLNLEFGLKPLASDINDAVVAFEHADALWRQLERDAGRHIRRRYSFPTVTATSVTSTARAYGWPLGPSYAFSSPGHSATLTKTKVTETRTWFSGAFRYCIPSTETSWSRFRREAYRWRQCYGADLSAQTIWNLTPWTWLSDWFINMQPLMSWLSAVSLDGMVMQYGYLMEHKTERTEYSLPGLKFHSGREISPSMTFLREQKRRVKASPYGFGLNWDGFTPRQLAILASLGITRSDHI